MTTKRERIIQALVTTIAGTSGVGNRIYRNRKTPLSKAFSPAVVVITGGETNSDNVVGSKDRYLTVMFTAYVNADNAETVADGVIESLHSKVMADHRLGGLSLDIQEGGTTFEMDEIDREVLWATIAYKVHYRTLIEDLTQ